MRMPFTRDSEDGYDLVAAAALFTGLGLIVYVVVSVV